MAPSLGKRKRKGTDIMSIDRAASVESSSSLEQDAQAVFRRHFEAHFKPLRLVEKAAQVIEDVHEPASADETDWEGISEAGGRLQVNSFKCTVANRKDDEKIEVIEHTILQPSSSMSKEELKAFMVGDLVF
jgi:hypothetical protein